MNLLVKKNLVRCLPKVEFTKYGLCDACQKREAKKSIISRVRESHQLMNPCNCFTMDLFGPVNILSISKKKYCLIIVDDITRFSWTFFLHSKDEASQLIINHIKDVDNGLKWNVKKIRSDNGTEFKNLQ